MAMSKTMHRAINALTQLCPDVNLTYKVERSIEKVSSAVRVKTGDYETWDHEVWNNEAGRSVPVRVYRVGKQPITRLLLFFHGGGWVLGNIDSYNKLCLTLAKQTGWAVASVDYALAPEYPFPAGLEDCYSVARELYTGALPGVKKEHIVMVGDSAGGNLAAAVSLMARDKGEFSPSAQILIYPATNNDHSENSPYLSISQNGSGYLLTTKRIIALVGMYMKGREDKDNPYFAPILATNFNELPRTLILTAEFDPLRDEGEHFGQKLIEAGIDAAVHRVADSLHGFMSLSTRFNAVREAYALINDFLARAERRE